MYNQIWHKIASSTILENIREDVNLFFVNNNSILTSFLNLEKEKKRIKMNLFYENAIVLKKSSYIKLVLIVYVYVYLVFLINYTYFVLKYF